MDFQEENEIDEFLSTPPDVAAIADSVRMKYCLKNQDKERRSFFACAWHRKKSKTVHGNCIVCLFYRQVKQKQNI